MRKTTCLVCAVTLPATDVDKTDNFPIAITETLLMPKFIMVFTSFDAFIVPLEKPYISFPCMKNYHLNPQQQMCNV